MFRWTYTAAALPSDLRSKIQPLVGRIMSMPGGPGAMDNQTCGATILLMWLFATDPALAADRALHKPITDEARWLCEPLNEIVTTMLDTAYEYTMKQMVNKAADRDAKILVDFALRGAGLCASPYGLLHKRALCEQLLCAWCGNSLPQLAAWGYAHMRLALKAGRFCGPPMTPLDKHKYGIAAASWAGKEIHVATGRAPSHSQASAEAVLSAERPGAVALHAVLTHLRSRSATHVPVIVRQTVPHELMARDGHVSVPDTRKPYKEVMAGRWQPHELPKQVRDMPVGSSNELLDAETVHSRVWLQLGAPLAKPAYVARAPGAASPMDALRASMSVYGSLLSLRERSMLCTCSAEAPALAELLA